MSEVDRLSNSGLYPALPVGDAVGDKRRDGSRGRPPSDAHDEKPADGVADGVADGAGKPDSKTPRPPKSIIDEYA